MIRLDHTYLAVADLEAAVAAYDRIFGRCPALWTQVEGARCAYYVFPDFTLRLVTPQGPGPLGDLVRQKLADDGEGLFDLGFRVDDLETWRRRLGRLSLDPDPLTDLSVSGESGGPHLAWTQTALPREVGHGVGLTFVKPKTPCPKSKVIAEAPMIGLDLVVLSTPEPDRAAALYGARLGLPMVLDRRPPAEGGSRLMQFSCDTLMLEVTHNPQTHPAGSPDRVWGISWEVADADATRARLAGAGFNVSEVKIGAKPGTRVFTLRNGACGVPTLVMQRMPTE